MGGTFAKKELQKKKAKAKQEKAEKRKERKQNNDKGKSLEEMMVYLDEDGNFTSTPPDTSVRREVNIEDIQLGAAPKLPENNTARTGIVSNFNEEKGYGFITDSELGQDVFVHINETGQPLRKGNKVTYAWEKGPKGYVALDVKIVK